MTEWISVKERRLPLNEYILIIVRAYGCIGRQVFSVIFYAPQHGWFPTVKGKFELDIFPHELINKIEYWMPLPELPKEEE